MFHIALDFSSSERRYPRLSCLFHEDLPKDLVHFILQDTHLTSMIYRMNNPSRFEIVEAMDKGALLKLCVLKSKANQLLPVFFVTYGTENLPLFAHAFKRLEKYIFESTGVRNATFEDLYSSSEDLVASCVTLF